MEKPILLSRDAALRRALADLEVAREKLASAGQEVAKAETSRAIEAIKMYIADGLRED